MITKSLAEKFTEMERIISWSKSEIEHWKRVAQFRGRVILAIVALAVGAAIPFLWGML